MIISCNNCKKKFEINPNLIPNNGRLVKCSSCNHEWFFKKKILQNIVESNDITKTEEFEDSKDLPIFDKNKENYKNANNLEEKQIPHNKDLTIFKKKENKKIILPNLILVWIISFVAFIILLDTFQYQINSVVPNLEFLLYNLYESIKDVFLFLKDLT